MKFTMLNDGTCTRVKLYGEDVRKTLTLNDWQETSLEDAEYIFINTCSFLKSKEDYYLSYITKINNSLKVHQTICIIGCLPSINKDAILKINNNITLLGRNIDEIMTHFKLHKRLKYLSTELDEKLNRKKKIIYLLNKYLLHSKHIDFRLKKNKVCHIQIAVGCQGKCTYCSERMTVKLKSRKIDDILEAVEDGLKRGYQLFSLNADDVSAYGKDNDESFDLLLDKVLSIKKNFYICIPEFNPNGLTPKVLSLLKDKRILYLTIPIQSGSNDILKRMKRPYNIEEVIENVKILKKSNRKLKINTHVIVGFPGETEDDFNKTLSIIKKGYFDRLRIFKYSDRPMTEASQMDNKIDDTEKQKRHLKLRRQVIINSLKKVSLSTLILNLEII